MAPKLTPKTPAGNNAFPLGRYTGHNEAEAAQAVRALVATLAQTAEGDGRRAQAHAIRRLGEAALRSSTATLNDVVSAPCLVDGCHDSTLMGTDTNDGRRACYQHRSEAYSLNAATR